MNVQPGLFDDDALRRIAAHCRSLDPAAPTARERLEDALGVELARKLVFALATGRPRERRAA
jgi:cytochrome c553